MTDSFEEKTRRNVRVKARYDELTREGKHGHYETMFRVVHEEVAHDRAEIERLVAALKEYVEHKPTCDVASGLPNRQCSCGLNDIIQSLLNRTKP